MKKIGKGIVKVFMELMTCTFSFVVGCFVCDFMYEMTDNWSWGGGIESVAMGLMFLLGYIVIRYQARERLKTYMEQISPKIERVAGMLNQINESSKDKVA